MIKLVVSDFSRVLLFPIETYEGDLNNLNDEMLAKDPDYPFWDYFYFNDELLEFYANLSLPVVIYTSRTIQNHPEVKKKIAGKFQYVLSALEMGISKTDNDGFAKLAEHLGVKPEEILFLDDRDPNIAAATAAGFQTIQYKSNQQAMPAINEQINA